MTSQSTLILQQLDTEHDPAKRAELTAQLRALLDTPEPPPVESDTLAKIVLRDIRRSHEQKIIKEQS